MSELGFGQEVQVSAGTRLTSQTEGSLVFFSSPVPPPVLAQGNPFNRIQPELGLELTPRALMKA